MAETTADVRRDIELTRERMTSTLAQLESKLNVSRVVTNNPWPAVGVAFAAGLLLSGTRADVKAGAVTLMATKGASSRIAPALDDIVARLMQGVGEALQARVDELIEEIKVAIGAPTGTGTPAGSTTAGSTPASTATASTAPRGEAFGACCFWKMRPSFARVSTARRDRTTASRCPSEALKPHSPRTDTRHRGR